MALNPFFNKPVVKPPAPPERVVQSPTDPDPGHGVLEDIWHGAKGGVISGLENTIEAVGLLPGVPEFDIGVRDNFKDPTSLPGRLTEGIFQFLTGFIPAVGVLGKFGKLGKLGKLVSRSKAGKLLMRLGEGSAAGAIADFLVFPGDQERLSDILVMMPGMEDSVFQFLASDPSDSEAEGRLKNVIEGFGLGTAANGIFLGLKAIKGRLFREGLKAGDEIAEEAPEIIKEFTDPKTAEEVAKEAGDDVVRLDQPAVLIEEDAAGLAAERLRREKVTTAYKSRAGEDLAVIRDAARRRTINTVKIEEALKIADEAISRGDDPVRAIRGVANLAVLDDVESARLIDTLVEHSPTLEKTATGEQLIPLKVSKEEMFDRAAEEASRLLESPPEALAARFAAFRTQTTDMAGQYATLSATLRGYARDVAEIGRLAIDGTPDQIAGRMGEVATREEMTLLFTQKMDFLRRILGYWGGARGEWGVSGLAQQRAVRWTVGAEEALRILDGGGGFSAAQKAARNLNKMLGLEGGEDMAVAAAKRWDPTRAKWSLAQTWYINSLLSSFKTFGFINVMGNAMTAFWAPTEQLLGAHLTKFGKTLSGQSTEEVDALISGLTRSFTELTHGWHEAMSIARASWKTGDSVLLGPGRNSDHIARGGISVDTVQQAFPHAARGLSPDQGMGKALEAIGNVIELPSSILISQDEVFKQISFRASAAAQFGELGYRKGYRGKDLDVWVERQMVRSQHEGEAMSQDLIARMARDRTVDVPPEARRELAAREIDRLTKEMEDGDVLNIARKASADAEERTFTNQLKKDRHILAGMGSSMQKLTLQHPSLKFLLPFIQTPMNILVYASRRTVLSDDMLGAVRYMGSRMGRSTPNGALSRSKNRWIREMTSPKTAVRNEAFSRMVTAVGMTTTALGLAAGGVITGAGPEDRNLREVMQQSGWQPYSIKVGDTYVQYKRLDPLASILGVFADMFDFARWDVEDAEGFEAALISTIVSMTDNIRSKSYLQGLSDIFGAVEDPERGIPSLLGRVAGGFVVPGAVGQFLDVSDPFIREPQGMIQRLMGRTPGLSSEVEAHRNVLGEEMNRRMLDKVYRTPVELLTTFVPLHINRTSNDVINQEFALLQYGFANPSSKKYGTDLREHRSSSGQTAYDRWMQLTGEVVVGGLRLKDRLSRMIRSSRYQKLPYEGVEALGEESPRIQEVQKVISRYRAVAEQRMLREYDGLRQQARAKVLAQRSLALGQSPLAVESRLIPGR